MSMRLLRVIVTVAGIMALTLVSVPARISTAAGPVNLRIFVGLGTGTDEGQVKQEDALAKQWNDANPDIQIKFDYNDYNTSRQVLLTQVAADNAPDLVGPVGISGLNSTGDLWADLSQYIAQDKASLNFSDFDPSTLTLYQLNGKDIAIPLGLYPSFMYVDKDLFQAAGVKLPPTDYNNGSPTYNGKPWDMNAVRDIAIKLTQDKNGMFADEQAFDPTNIVSYGFADVDIDMRGYAQLFSPGHNGVSADGKQALFNDPTYLQAMQWRHDAIFKDHFFPDVSAQKLLTNGGSTVTFPSGKVAMVYSHTWALDPLSDVKFKWGVAVAPMAPNGKLTARIDADTFSIMEKSKNKDAAWKVLKWLTSATTASQLCGIYGCLPARASARGDWEKAIKDKFPDLDLTVIYGAIKYLDTPNYDAYMPNYNQAFDHTNEFMAALDSDPNMDVKTALDKFNTEMQAIFEGKVPEATPEATAASN